MDLVKDALVGSFLSLFLDKKEVVRGLRKSCI